MNSRSNNLLANLDWVAILLYVLLVLIGWINIYAAVYDENHSSILDISQKYGKQLIWIGAAFVLALLVLLTDSKFYSSFSLVIYGFMIALLIAVLLFGKEVKGSRSWFGFGDFGFSARRIRQVRDLFGNSLRDESSQFQGHAFL